MITIQLKQRIMIWDVHKHPCIHTHTHNTTHPFDSDQSKHFYHTTKISEMFCVIFTRCYCFAFHICCAHRFSLNSIQSLVFWWCWFLLLLLIYFLRCRWFHLHSIHFRAHLVGHCLESIRILWLYIYSCSTLLVISIDVC